MDAALARGITVRAIVRDRARASAVLPPSVELVEADLRDATAMGAAIGGADVLVHAAAAYSYARSDANAMLRDNAAVTTSVLGAAERKRTPLVVYVSSVIVFAPHGVDRGRVTDAESPLWDASTRRWGDPYLRSKVEAEQQARDAAARGVPVTFIHPALVVGPDDRGPGTSGGPILRMLTGGSMVDGAGGWVDVRDVADAMVTACSRPAGGRYLLSAETVSYRGIARRLDVVTRRRRRHLIIPRAVTRALAPLNDLAGGRVAPALPTRPSLEYILNASRIDGSSGEALLGRPYRRLDDTLRDAIAWWVDHGMVDARNAGAAAPASHGAT